MYKTPNAHIRLNVLEKIADALKRAPIPVEIDRIHPLEDESDLIVLRSNGDQVLEIEDEDFIGGNVPDQTIVNGKLVESPSTCCHYECYTIEEAFDIVVYLFHCENRYIKDAEISHFIQKRIQENLSFLKYQGSQSSIGPDRLDYSLSIREFNYTYQYRINPADTSILL